MVFKIRLETYVTDIKQTIQSGIVNTKLKALKNCFEVKYEFIIREKCQEKFLHKKHFLQNYYNFIGDDIFSLLSKTSVSTAIKLFKLFLSLCFKVVIQYIQSYTCIRIYLQENVDSDKCNINGLALRASIVRVAVVFIFLKQTSLLAGCFCSHVSARMGLQFVNILGEFSQHTSA